MVDFLVALTIVLAFLSTFFLTPVWIKMAKKQHLTGKDMNKISNKSVAEAGGIAVVAGFVFAVLIYIGIQTFIFKDTTQLTNILAILVTILIITIIGLLDDILGWKKGLKQWQKPLLTIPAAIPLMMVNVGTSTMNLPFLGNVDFGLLYPLLLIPLAIVGTSNGYNMLAGHNGLEAGLGVIILSFMGYVAWISGLGWLALLSFCMTSALLAFLVFNWYPAKVFPGDTLTYSVGALIGIVAIMGNMEKIAIILFIPFFIELFLKAKYKFKTENFCTPNKDNTLSLPKGNIYSVCHLSLASLFKINKKLATEQNIVILIYFMEILLVFICVVGFLL